MLNKIYLSSALILITILTLLSCSKVELEKSIESSNSLEKSFMEKRMEAHLSLVDQLKQDKKRSYTFEELSKLYQEYGFDIKNEMNIRENMNKNGNSNEIIIDWCNDHVDVSCRFSNKFRNKGIVCYAIDDYGCWNFQWSIEHNHCGSCD